MKIKEDSDIPEVFLEEEGIRDVYRKILIGPQDGSSRIVMRYFKVLPGETHHFIAIPSSMWSR
jgi:hypothetical protein